MPYADLIVSQLTDPFRIGLLLFLALTTRRTSAQTGYAIPLAVGALFVAFLIPTTMGSGQTGGMTAIAAGVVSNIIILAVILGVLMLWSRLAARKTN